MGGAFGEAIAERATTLLAGLPRQEIVDAARSVSLNG
jgi:hypothetical protein